jgi:hypothetical protein
MALSRACFERAGKDRSKSCSARCARGSGRRNFRRTEVVVVNNPDGGRSLLLLFFESDDDCRRGDKPLNGGAGA